MRKERKHKRWLNFWKEIIANVDIAVAYWPIYVNNVKSSTRFFKNPILTKNNYPDFLLILISQFLALYTDSGLMNIKHICRIKFLFWNAIVINIDHLII